MAGRTTRATVALIALTLLVGAVPTAGAATATSAVGADASPATHADYTTEGMLNNSTLESLNQSQLVDRTMSLQTVLSQTQEQYRKAYVSLQLELNEEQGVETNTSVDYSATADTTEPPRYNESQLDAMSAEELRNTVRSYQQVIEQTQTAYLNVYRELQIQLTQEQTRETETATPTDTPTDTPTATDTPTDTATATPTEETTTSGPGFGVATAALALLAAAGVALRRD